MRSSQRPSDGGLKLAESTRTILTAVGANLAIAVAKFVGAALTGSSAMLAEGVHSVVDTLNQGLLLVGLKRAQRPADAKHPFGYGREVYFYSFVVALLIFLAGGLYSIYEGIEKLSAPDHGGNVTIGGVQVSGFTVNLAILGFAIAAEGYSFYVAYTSLPKGFGSPFSTIRRSKDPSLFVVLVEDLAALIGLFLALAGVVLAHLLDLPVLDGSASIAIGIVLIGMAVFLMIETHGLLIGEAADPDVVDALKALVGAEPDVCRINEILTQHLGPKDILVNLSLDIRDSMSGGEVETLVSRLDAALKVRVKDVKRLFIEIQGWGLSAVDGAEAPTAAQRSARAGIS